MKPTAEEARDIMIEAKLPIELMGDITTPTMRSTATMEGKVIKLMIDYPVVKRTDIERPHDIKFFVSKNTLVTVHYEDITALYSFKKSFEVLTLLGKTERMNGAHLFASLMNILYDALTKKLDYLDEQLEAIDHQILSGREKEMVFEISKISRKLITFKQSLIAHGDVMHDAHPFFVSVFGKSISPTLTELDEFYDHIMRRLHALTESVKELNETNQALLSTKEGEIMKTLTIMAFITFPLTLVSSVFGMNAVHMPLVGQEYDFWIILGMMTLMAGLFFVYFSYKRWF